MRTSNYHQQEPSMAAKDRRGGNVRRSTVALVVLVTLAAAGPAGAARQMRAGDPPRVSGPYLRVDDSCSKQGVRTEQGERVAVSEVCLFLFEYDPLRELDLISHHAAVWVQATLAARPGWCTIRADVEIRISSEGRIYAHAPGGRSAPARAQPTTIELRSDAGGYGLQEGAVAQDLSLLAGRWSSELSGTDEGSALKTTFTGSQNSTLAFATGAAFSYPMLAPPMVQGGFSRYDFVKAPSC